MVFTAGALPWHKLGQNVAQAQTWEQAMELAHLDWEVTAEPIRTDFGVVDGYSAIVREDRPATVLGIVGDGYEIIQNRAAFDFTEALLETGARR